MTRIGHWSDRVRPVDQVARARSITDGTGPMDSSHRERGWQGMQRPMSLLDDEALCRTWRHSFVDMGSDCSVEVKLGIVDHRRRCLDELERRSPDGFAAWLASGARAAGDPLPFLQDPRCRRNPGR
jgi:hypothetical protein